MACIRIGSLHPADEGITSYEIDYWYDREEQRWGIRVLNNLGIEEYSEVNMKRPELIDAIGELKGLYTPYEIRHL